MVAWDSVGKQAVKSTSFQVYAMGDTGFVTPLPITDPFGTPLPGNILNSGTVGVFPEFKQADNPTVRITDAARNYIWTVASIVADDSVAGYVGNKTTAAAAAVRAATASVWQSSTTYAVNQSVINPTGDLMRCTTAHTSTAAYDSAKFTLVATDANGATSAALSATYVPQKFQGRNYSKVKTDGTNQTTVLQGEIDSLAAAGGGDLYLPAGTILADVILKDFVNPIGLAKLITILKSPAGSTAAGCVMMAAGPVRACLKNLSVVGNGNANQKGIYLQAVGNGGVPNHGGWWNSGLDNVRVSGFAGDQIWLRGGGADFLKPHQFLTFKDVEAYTTGTAAALRITGQVAQVDLLGHCQFDGPSSSGGTGTNIVVTREVNDAMGNVSDVAPSAIRFGNVTTQDNKRGYTIERAAGVVIEGGWWENLAEGLEANTSAPLVRVKGVYTANVGANAGAGWVMKAAGGALISAEENTFAGTVDKHFINSFGDGILQRNNITTAGTPVVTDGITPNIGVSTAGAVVLGSARDALVNTALLAAPVLSAPTTATTGGTLAAATYFYKATYTNAAGETVGSNEISQATTGAASTVTFTIGAAPSGATGTKIYRSTTTGTEVLLDTLATTPTSYTDNGSKTPGTATVPATNTTNTPIMTITSKAGPGERVSIKAWGGALVLNNTGNINASGLTMPYTVPSNALVTLVKYDLGAVWNIENVSTQ